MPKPREFVHNKSEIVLRIQLQFHTITMSNGRIQYERKAAGKLILKHLFMKTVIFIVITEKRLKCFFKGDRGEEDELTISELKEL